MHNEDVLFSEMAGKGGNLGIITLNRPKALNALSLHMIKAMHAQLRQWEIDARIKAVIICAAEGRAFCAGGDLRLTYQGIAEHAHRSTSFFREEYALNHCIYHYPKPYIALLDGITFGGGVGISIHGSHRIATENLLFAMPETGIGFFPDVGGTYFLPRLPQHIGFYLGLTGTRLAADDCVQLGIAQQKVASEVLPDVVMAIAESQFGNDARADVTAVIQQFSLATETAILKEATWIDHVFSQANMETIVKASEEVSPPLANELFAKKSPLSLKVSLLALQRGAKMNFDACMEQEYRLATRFLLGHDFAEGIRAVIIDKDQNPRWEPSTLLAVSPEAVEKYFAPLPQELFQ